MLNFTHVTEGRALSVIGPLSFMRPLYLHGRQRSKVHVQICVNALMLYSWPSAFQLAWTGTSPCLWFSKPAEAESRMWIDLNAALLKMIIKTSGFDGRKWILWCIWLVFSDFSHVCQHVKWVYFYSGWKKVTRKDVKLQFCWPAPGLFDRHTAILTKCDSSFSKPAPLKFLTPTPRWMAIGFLFWLKVVKPSVKMGKKAW